VTIAAPFVAAAFQRKTDLSRILLEYRKIGTRHRQRIGLDVTHGFVRKAFFG
jgi:hypothetical protein